MSTFDEAYDRMRPVLDRAGRRLKALLRDVLGCIEDRRLVRVEFHAVRPKSRSSLKRKAKRAGWGPDDELSRCPDLVGGRVICNNVEDIYRFEELLLERLRFDAEQVERQDYTLSPKRGYRALHLNFRLDVGQSRAPQMIPCEVQIRTRLQDAWAEVSHADIYKRANLPADLRARAEDLSRLLAAADEIAGDIRSRVRQLTEPPAMQPPLDRVSAEGLTYIFADVFGRTPPDYVLAMALSTCSELDIVALEGLPQILKRQGFREKLNAAYRAVLRIPIDSESIMLAGLHALAADDGAAVRYVREQAQMALDEFDHIAKREMLSDLPATVKQLTAELSDPLGRTDIGFLANALGATDNCRHCGATVVDVFGVTEASTQHYGLSGADADQVCELIRKAIFTSGVDTGAEDPTVCSHCAGVIAKGG